MSADSSISGHKEDEQDSDEGNVKSEIKKSWHCYLFVPRN